MEASLHQIRKYYIRDTTDCISEYLFSLWKCAAVRRDIFIGNQNVNHWFLYYTNIAFQTVLYDISSTHTEPAVMITD